MKKLFALFLALSLLLCLAACGSGEHVANTDDNKETTANTTDATTDPTNETQESIDSTEGATGRDPTEPTEPTPTEPKPTEPKPTEPKPTEPKPTEPKPTEPKPTEPKPTEPKPTEPQVNNSQNQQAEYERALGEINIEYNRVVAEIHKEHNDNLLNLAAAKLEADSQIGSLRAACQSQLNSLSNQKNALIREKDQALANALANTGGQYNSYYDTLKKQYDDRIAAIDNQIAQTNSKYSKQISEWQTYLNNLPTVEDYEYLRYLKLQDVENWKSEQIKSAKAYYGIA